MIVPRQANLRFLLTDFMGYVMDVTPLSQVTVS